MTLTFYPHTDDVQKGSMSERLDVFMEAAERYRAIILDMANKTETSDAASKKRVIPRDLTAAYNWEELTRILREIREIAEISKSDKVRKADLLSKLSEIYEVLRAARMPKLEAVRLALISEANQLRGGASQVA